MSPRWVPFCNSFLAHAAANLAATTISGTYRPTLNTVTAQFGNMRVSDFTRVHADEWVSALSKRLQKSSIRTRILAVNAAFNWGIDEGAVKLNPFSQLTLPDAGFRGRVLSDDEIPLLLPHIYDDRVRRACILSLYTGLRCNEAARILWADVRLDYIKVRSEIAKSGKARTIRIGPEAIAAMGDRQDADRKVFGITRNVINFVLRAAWQKSGLGYLRFHDFRHTACARFFEKSDDVFAAMDIFGWASPASAVPYQHMTQKRQAQALLIHYPPLERATPVHSYLP